MQTKDLETLYHDTLKDVFYAERQILKALPKMARAAQSPELKEAFSSHKTETEGQVERLRQAFDLLGKRPQGKTCPAIDGILEEGAELIEEYGKSPALDAALTGAAQAVEHYEMARYGALASWAELLGQDEAAALLRQTLAEEQTADKTLTGLSAEVNSAAMAVAAE